MFVVPHGQPHGQQHGHGLRRGGNSQVAGVADTRACVYSENMTTTRTAVQVLTDSIALGMNANGWSFDQAYSAAVASMIVTDRAAMVALAGNI